MHINIEVPDYFADHIIEYFCDSMYMLGIDIDANKGVRYSGFWSQGDGASFKGFVNFSNCNIGQFEKCYPTDEAMLDLAKRWESVAAELQEVELKLGFHHHRYCHENTMETEDWYAEDDQRLKIEELEDEVLDILKGFAQQLYTQLEAEYNYALAYETASRYDELAAEVKTLQEQILELDSVPEIPSAVVITHMKELQANRHELLEILESQMSQLESQFHFWKDRKQMSIHEFLEHNF